jgi:hypothetical protein
MGVNRWGLLALLLALIFSAPGTGLADDLDDGISKATDDALSKDDELGQADKNINFIKLKAKSQAQVRSKDGTGGVDQKNGQGGTAQGGGQAGAQKSGPASGNMNSVLVGPGGSVRGDIIIIDESKGNKTQVVE